MNEFTITPEFEEKMRAASRVPAANPVFVDRLRSQLVKRSTEMQPRPYFSSRLAWRFALAVLLVLISAALLIGPQRIVNAMRELFGYIPGVGMVSQDAPLRVLKEPASVTRAGVTISVSQAVLDSTHSLLVYQVDGLPADSIYMIEPDAKQPLPICIQSPKLRLPDGKLLEPDHIYQGKSWVSGNDERISYPALPAQFDNAVLVVACVDGTKNGSVPENWEIPLHFVPAPPQMTVYPVIDIATPTPAASPSAPVPQASPSATGQLAFPYGVSLALDRVVQLQDGYLLQASLNWNGDELYVAPPPDDPQTRLLDANGQEIPIEASQSDQPYAPTTQRYFMDYKTDSITASGPLTLSVDSIAVVLSTKGSFAFDPGPDPKAGQTWPLDQDLVVDGYRIHVRSANVVSLGNAGLGYSFDMESDNGVMYATVDDLEHPTSGGSGGGSGGPSFSASFSYAGGLQHGPITVTITEITVRLAGPWQVSWTPPPGSVHAASPTPRSNVCLTSAAIQKALANPGTLPPGLGGRLAFDAIYYPPNNDYTNYPPWKVAVGSLDGSNIQTLTVGSWASFSPDGTRVVYGSPDGLVIATLATGATSVLPGTASTDINPLWSRDGKEIAFVRGPAVFDIFLIDADGSNLRQLTHTNVSESIVAWMPDGSGLLFSVPGPNGSSHRVLDPQTGKTRTLLNVNYDQSNIDISPDGKRLAFSEKVFGDKVAWYVSNLDGSQRRLLIDTEPTYTISPAFWSPDGDWLAFTVSDQVEHSMVHVTLLQVDTCQIVLLPKLVGNVSAWAP